MKEELGVKGGKKEKKLTWLNFLRKQKKKQQELAQEKKKELEKKKKILKEITIRNLKQEKGKEQETSPSFKRRKVAITKTQKKKKLEIKQEILEEKQEILEKKQENLKKNIEPLEKGDLEEKKTLAKTEEITDKKKETILPTQQERKEKKDSTISYSDLQKPKDILEESSKNKSSVKKVALEEIKELQIPTTKEEQKEKDTIQLEAQITKIIQNQLEKQKLELKKIEEELYQKQKQLNNPLKIEEMEELKKELEKLTTFLEHIKKNLASLEKTFQLKFPVTEPDFTLIALVEEYQKSFQKKWELEKKLKDNKEFASIMEQLLYIEKKKEELEKKLEIQKKETEENESKIQKMEDDITEIDSTQLEIEKFIKEQENILADIKQKLKETVQITKKVEIITKQVNHSFLELFLLMGLLKKNLGLSGGIVNFMKATILLDIIHELCTPIQKQVIRKEINVTDYQNLITDSMNSTKNLEKLMDENIGKLSSIRYQLEHFYQEYSHLESFQEAIKNLDSLEKTFQEKKKDISKMKSEINKAFDKNQEKVKKYGSIEII